MDVGRRPETGRRDQRRTRRRVVHVRHELLRGWKRGHRVDDEDIGRAVERHGVARRRKPEPECERQRAQRRVVYERDELLRGRLRERIGRRALGRYELDHCESNGRGQHDRLVPQLGVMLERDELPRGRRVLVPNRDLRGRRGAGVLDAMGWLDLVAGIGRRASTGSARQLAELLPVRRVLFERHELFGGRQLPGVQHQWIYPADADREMGWNPVVAGRQSERARIRRTAISHKFRVPAPRVAPRSAGVTTTPSTFPANTGRWPKSGTGPPGPWPPLRMRPRTPPCFPAWCARAAPHAWPSVTRARQPVRRPSPSGERERPGRSSRAANAAGTDDRGARGGGVFEHNELLRRGLGQRADG